MINLNLTRHELHVLSNFSRIPMGRESILLDKQLEEIFDFEGEHCYQAYQRMVRDGFITGYGKEEGLAKEFEPLFMLLLQPEWSLQVRRLVKDDYGVVTFSFSHGFGAMIEQSDDGSVYSVSYPYTETVMEAWIRGTIFADSTFIEPAIGSHSLSLSMDECLFMDVLLSLLKERVMTKKGPLEREETIITSEDMADFDGVNDTDGILLRGIGQTGVSEFLGNSASVDTVRSLLTEKGIIETDDDGILISELGKEIFNPGKIKDCILISEIAASHKSLGAVYLMTDGYLVMETKGTGDAMVNVIGTYPGNTPMEQLMQGLTTMCFRKGID